jgi:hypothetical protein
MNSGNRPRGKTCHAFSQFGACIVGHVGQYGAAQVS